MRTMNAEGSGIRPGVFSYPARWNRVDSAWLKETSPFNPENATVRRILLKAMESWVGYDPSRRS